MLWIQGLLSELLSYQILERNWLREAQQAFHRSSCLDRGSSDAGGLRAEPSYHSRLNLPLLVWVLLRHCQHWGKMQNAASQSMGVFSNWTWALFSGQRFLCTSEELWPTATICGSYGFQLVFVEKTPSSNCSSAQVDQRLRSSNWPRVLETICLVKVVYVTCSCSLEVCPAVDASCSMGEKKMPPTSPQSAASPRCPPPPLRGLSLCVRDSLHIVVLLFAFEFFSIDFHAMSHESLAGKGFVSFSLAFCESNDALMLPHFSLFFIPYLLKEGIPLYW